MSFFDYLKDKRDSVEPNLKQSDAIVTSVQISRPDGSLPATNITATDVLAGAYDPSKLHPLAGIGDSLDYLLLDDDKLSSLPGATTALPTRGWSDDLCYGTGTTYLAGV